MFRLLSLTAVTATAAAAAALLVPSSGAGADPACTAWASLPARVSLGPGQTTVRTTLVGTSGCAAGGPENGAKATLQAPGTRYPMRWLRFGDHDSVVLYASLARPGTYRMVAGDVQTYDKNYLRVPAAWRTTTTVVKYRSRFTSVHRSGGRLAATLQFYGPSGWTRHTRTAVTLERRTGSGGWRSVGHARTSGSGAVSFAVGSGRYRLVSAASARAWGTTSR